jgi:hypothetical protein
MPGRKSLSLEDNSDARERGERRSDLAWAFDGRSRRESEGMARTPVSPTLNVNVST